MIEVKEEDIIKIRMRPSDIPIGTEVHFDRPKRFNPSEPIDENEMKFTLERAEQLSMNLRLAREKIEKDE